MLKLLRLVLEDVAIIYSIPQNMQKKGLDKVLMVQLNLPYQAPDLSMWNDLWKPTRTLSTLASWRYWQVHRLKTLFIYL